MYPPCAKRFTDLPETVKGARWAPQGAVGSNPTAAARRRRNSRPKWYARPMEPRPLSYPVWIGVGVGVALAIVALLFLLGIRFVIGL